MVEAMDGLARGDQPEINMELRHRGRAGWMWVRMRAVGSYGPGGELEEISGTCQDITRARATEDQLQDLVTQNSLMHAVASAANQATTLEEVMEQVGTMVVLHDDWDRARAFVPTPDGEGLVPYLETDTASGVPLPGGEGLALEAADAVERAVADECYRLGRAVWDDEDKLTIAAPIALGDEIVAVVTITSRPPLYRHELIQQMLEQACLLISRVAEREASARELAQARDRALQASQHKSDFLATMSHEIRTPLNGIIGLNELLSHTQLSDDQRHFVSGVAVSSRTLLELLNNILDFSKIEAGHLEVEAVDFEVRQVLAEVGGMLSEPARERGIDLRISCSPEVPGLVNGDPTRLKQVLLNLGSNALKFTTDGSVGVRVSTEVVDDDGSGSGGSGEVLRFAVQDTGMGITPEQQEHIFAPFAQADTSTTRRFGGTGLGLAICQEIVSAFGGEIGVESEPGTGSTFWFTVPLRPASAGATDEVTAQARRALGELRVLVIDDEERDWAALGELLGWWGVMAGLATHSSRARAELLDAKDSEPYDAVLWNAGPSEQQGSSLAAAVLSLNLPSDLPVIVMTPSHLAVDARPARRRCRGLPRPTGLLRGAARRVAGARRTRQRRGRRRLPCVAARDALTPGLSGRVLVVEDNLINQWVARGYLEAQGFGVVTADNGEIALALLAEEPFDLVFMDVQMPVLDGYATTRALRLREAETGAPRLPIIAMTAAAISDERERCTDAGMDDFLTKPFSVSALEAVLDRWAPQRETGPRPPTEPPARALEPSPRPRPPRRAARPRPRCAGLPRALNHQLHPAGARGARGLRARRPRGRRPRTRLHRPHPARQRQQPGLADGDRSRSRPGDVGPGRPGRTCC